jgi:hypothetical protein
VGLNLATDWSEEAVRGARWALVLKARIVPMGDK